MLWSNISNWYELMLKDPVFYITQKEIKMLHQQRWKMNKQNNGPNKETYLLESEFSGGGGIFSEDIS